MSSYKRLKEEFVSNLNGSSMPEIAALSALVPVFVIIRMASQVPREAPNKKAVNATQCPREFSFKFWSSLGGDFMYIVFPTIACLTVLADHVYMILAVTLLLCAATVIRGKSKTTGHSQYASSSGIEKKKVDTTSSEHSTFISSYRFVMMIVTCVAILAVDFTIFPRRYAKAEGYGKSLMDLGVGSFVAANGMVSRQARNLSPVQHGGVIRNTSPLLILGIIRLLVTQGVDYQVHVGEYGVHWNFFFTLAMVALLTSTFPIAVPFFGLGILAAYQVVLLCGLNDYLLSNERGPGLLSLNKEGVFSLFGYWSLYLVSVQLGRHFILSPGAIGRKFCTSISFKSESSEKWIVAAEIWVLDFCLWLIVIILDGFVEKVSRRTCNMAYVVLVLAQNFEVIGFFALADLFFKARLLLMDVIGRNLLVTFLLANMLTGLVNLSIETIFVPPLQSFLVLTAYMAVLVSGVALLTLSNVRLKFW